MLFAVLCICAMPFGTADMRAAYADTERVYIGGFPIGITMNVGGLLIESVNGVETEYGTAYVDGLQRGDIITKVCGERVDSVNELQSMLDGERVSVELIRNGETLNIELTPITEVYTGKPRLGVKIKEKIYGIGTVTLVRRDGSYAALGHEIFDSDTDTHLPSADGVINACKILGIKQGKKGEAGAILASILADKVYGTITCNNRFGIAGRYDRKPDNCDLIEVASRDEVRPGSAQIRTTVDGAPEYFDIEIIKAGKQSGKKEKGIIFRVTDKRLLELTGGVVRGMSGSPIVQDGKLVGAVTHVFLNDFTKGYGVYVDCLN